MGEEGKESTESGLECKGLSEKVLAGLDGEGGQEEGGQEEGGQEEGEQEEGEQEAMIAKLDSALENDALAAVGASCVALLGVLALSLGVVPAQHTEAVGSIATAAGLFAAAAFRRAANRKRATD